MPDTVPDMLGVFLEPEMEDTLELVLLLSVAAFILCVFALLSIELVGRWRLATSKRAQARRRGR